MSNRYFMSQILDPGRPRPLHWGPVRGSTWWVWCFLGLAAFGGMAFGIYLGRF